MGTGDSKVVHHFGRADARNRSVDQIVWRLDLGFIGSVEGRADDRVIYIGWYECRVI